MRKYFLFFLIIFLTFCRENIRKFDFFENLDAQKTKSYLIEKDKNSKFRYIFNKKNLIKVNVLQCGIDVEIKFSDGDDYFIDRPTGSNSNESFLYYGDKDEVLNFDVYSIDPIKKFGYVDISIDIENADYNREKISAERNYLAGYRNRISAEKKHREAAIKFLDESIYSSRIYGDDELEAQALIQLGMVSHVLLDFSTAMDSQFKALDIFKKYSNHERLAYIYHEIAATYHRELNFSQALYYYHKSIQNWKTIDNTDNRAFTYSNISYLHSQLGNFQLSKEYLDICYTLAGKDSKSFTLFSILQKIGVHYLDIGNFSEAIVNLKNANRMARELGYHSDDSYLFTYLNLGDCYKALGDLDTARSWAIKGVELAKKAGLERTVGFGLWTLGEIEVASKNFDKANLYFKEAITKDMEDWKDNTYLSMGTSQYQKTLNHPKNDQNRISDLSLSLSYLKLAREHKPDPWTEAQSLFWEAKIIFELGQNSRIQDLEKAISNIEDHRLQMEDNRSRVSYFASYTHFYQLLFDMLYEKSCANSETFDSNKLFRSTEKIRGRTLLDLVNDHHYLPEDLPSAEDAIRYYDLLSQMEEHFEDETALARLEADLLPLARKMARLDADTKIIEPEEIRDASEVQAAIGPGTKLLTYAFGLENLYLLVLDAHHTQVHVLGKAEDLKDKVDLVSQFLRTHPLQRKPGSEQEYHQAMAALSAALLGPLSDLGAFDRLVFIPDRYLQRLPFAALPFLAEDQTTIPLGERFQTAVLPSASVWMALKERAAKYRTPRQTIALLANPVFNEDDPRLPNNHLAAQPGAFYPALPGTQKEVEAIAALAKGEASLETGFSANLGFVKGPSIGKYRYLHFATHGDIDPENPGQSSLVLSRFAANGQPIDGMLRLSDISQLEIHADLVTLSACETANGKMIRGEGLMSLARGFMAAGVPRVLGTLWKVPDSATAHFMTQFYEALLREGLTPSAALKKAQLAQAHVPKWQDPHYWAGFVLIGDWQ